jgi:threonine dehydratase
MTFTIIRRDITDILTATDDQLRDAQRLLAARMKLVVEPTGALAIAAIRANPELFAGKRVGVVISGGNVDMIQYGQTLAG